MKKPDGEQLLRAVADRIRLETGLRISGERMKELKEAIDEKYGSRSGGGSGSLSEIETAGVSDGELRSLAEAMTVGETYFYRHEAQLKVLSDLVLPERMLSARRLGLRGASVRIWCPGCSSGEEVYTIAMLAREKGVISEGGSVEIIGTDLHSRRLKTALEGVYSPRSIAGIPPGWRQKYFTQEEGGYRVREELKENVRFQVHNLCRDPYSFGSGRLFDIVFCRNVLIYFDRDRIRDIVERFADVLCPDGYLFLGSSETLWKISERFHTVEYADAFVYRKSESGITNDAGMTGSERTQTPAREPDRSALGDESGEAVSLEAWLVQRLRMNSDIASQTLQAMEDIAYGHRQAETGELARIFGPFEADVFAATIWAQQLANRDETGQAAGILDKVLSADPLFAPALYLRGVLSLREHRLNEAVDTFQRLLYLSPQSAAVHFQIGNIYRQKGDLRLARREYRRLIRVLDARVAGVDLYNEGISRERMRFLAEEALEAVNRPLQQKDTGL